MDIIYWGLALLSTMESNQKLYISHFVATKSIFEKLDTSEISS